MDLKQNYFELFALPVAFEIDRDALSARYRELQGQAHPDRVANGSDQEKRLAQQQAGLVNDAYQTLKSPQARARYLLSLRGIEVDERKPLPMAFLVEQMELREGLQAVRAAADPMAEIEAVLARVRTEQARMEAALGAGFATADPAALETVAETILKLQFVHKLEEDALKLEEEFF